MCVFESQTIKKKDVVFADSVLQVVRLAKSMFHLFFSFPTVDRYIFHDFFFLLLSSLFFNLFLSVPGDSAPICISTDNQDQNSIVSSSVGSNSTSFHHF